MWCVVVCDLETSWMMSPKPTGGCCAKKKNYYFKTSFWVIISGCPSARLSFYNFLQSGRIFHEISTVGQLYSAASNMYIPDLSPFLARALLTQLTLESQYVGLKWNIVFQIWLHATCFDFYFKFNYDVAHKKYFVCSLRYVVNKQGEETVRTSNLKLCVGTRNEPVTWQV